MKRPNKKQSLSIAGAIIVLALTAYGVVQYRNGPPVYASAISDDIRRSADFTLYVPRQLPSGYLLKNDDGVSFTNNILFMQFTRDDQTIFMSEQKRPSPEPSIQTLNGFKSLEVPIGKAVTGEQDGAAATIVLSSDSLITVTSDGSASSADLVLIAKRLQKVE